MYGNGLSSFCLRYGVVESTLVPRVLLRPIYVVLRTAFYIFRIPDDDDDDDHVSPFLYVHNFIFILRFLMFFYKVC